jgi:hypothetical protein
MKRITLSVRQMEQLLANQQNRTLSNRWTLYHRDMVAGRFNFGLSPIVLYRDGALADGQHRLRAAIEAGLPRTWYVVEIERDEIVRVDAGRPRSVRDHTMILGKPIHNSLLAAARMALLLECSANWNSKPLHSHHEILDAAERYGVREWSNRGPFRGWAQFVGLCCYLSVHVTGDCPREFRDRVLDGAMMSTDDPRLTLRSRLMHKYSTTTGTAAQHQLLWVCVRSWNAFATGEPMKRLVIPSPLTSIRPILEVHK